VGPRAGGYVLEGKPLASYGIRSHYHSALGEVLVCSEGNYVKCHE
jgi:hypothetical protein